MQPSVLPSPRATPNLLATPLSIPQASSCGASNGTPNPASEPLSERLFSARGVTAPKAYAPIRLQDDAILRQQISSILGAQLPSTAVIFKDLQTGKGVAINAEREFYAASLFKLFVMFEVLHQQSLGILRSSQVLTVTPYYDAFGLGPRRTSLCQKLTVGEAVEAMMSISDNAVAVMLQDLAGAGNINTAIKALGLQTSELSQDGRLPTTAADIALLLEAIGRMQALDSSRSQEMLRLMTLEQFDNGLRAGVPQEAVVAHKTGNWEGAIHDGGVIVTPRGSYLLVVLSEAGRAHELIKEISSLVYDHFSKGRTS